MKYTPHNWVLLKFVSEKHGTYYKVLAGWNGGYLDGSSWKLNSGITKVEYFGNHENPLDDYYDVYGYSGSVYKCYECTERLAGVAMGSVYAQLMGSGMVSDITMKEYLEEVKQ